MVQKDTFKDYQGSMQYEIYWSFTNQYPSGDDSDVQGAFFDQQLMKIHPHGASKFAGDNLYIGIYCLNSLHGSIAYSFGNQSLKKLNLCFKKKESNFKSFGSDQSNEIIPRKDQLRHFHEQSKEQVKQLINKECRNYKALPV